jgi:hypothetical protein
MGSTISNNIILKLELNKTPHMVLQISLINIEAWHQDPLLSSSIRMVLEQVILLQDIISLALHQSTEAFHLVQECQEPTLLLTMQ